MMRNATKDRAGFRRLAWAIAGELLRWLSGVLLKLVKALLWLAEAAEIASNKARLHARSGFEE